MPFPRRAWCGERIAVVGGDAWRRRVPHPLSQAMVRRPDAPWKAGGWGSLPGGLARRFTVRLGRRASRQGVSRSPWGIRPPHRNEALRFPSL